MEKTSATFLFPNKKGKRCQKCGYRVDCLIDELCFIDRRRLEKLNKILLRIAGNRREHVYSPSPGVLRLREVIAHYKFELEFPGSRAQRRADARQFICKFGTQVISDWEFSRSNNKAVFRLRD